MSQSNFFEIHYEIDERCLLNCMHCSSKHDVYKQVINYTSFIELIDRLCDKRIILTITGGEPLLSPLLTKFLEIIKDYKQIHSIGLLSSGFIALDQTISKEYALYLRSLGISFCYISLYSHDFNIHDHITQVKGSFHDTVQSIINLAFSGVKVNVHYVPMKLNSNNLNLMLEYFKSLNISEVRFLRLVKHGSAIQNWSQIGLSYEEQIHIAKELTALLSKINTKIKLTIAGFPEYWNCRPVETGSKCQAGISLLYIDKYGDVYPCACKKNDEKYKIFNLRNHSSIEFANNKPYNYRCLGNIK